MAALLLLWHTQRGEYETTADFCREALRVEPRNVKAHFRLAKVLPARLTPLLLALSTPRVTKQPTRRWLPKDVTRKRRVPQSGLPSSTVGAQRRWQP